MPRISDVLERESRTVDIERGDFERLLGRRDRKERNRRIRSGVVAVVVALAAGIILFRSFLPDKVPADRLIPKPPPAVAGTLAYALDGDIFVAHADGSHAVRVANGLPDGECSRNDGGESYSAEGPMWSPDARYLAYRYWGCSKPRSTGVVISDAEGNVLARFSSDGWQIAWSPDSTRVAVWDTFDYEGPSTVGVYGVDGVRQAQLAMPAGWIPSGDHDPQWMPDGTGVWVEDVELPLDGSPPRYLPARGGDPYATYSPDGSLIAYAAAPPPGSLMVARSDGSEPRKVFNRGADGSSDWGYIWSPTGDQLAFAWRGLRILDVASGSVTLLSHEEPGTHQTVIGFSPQGDRILVRRDQGNKSSLWSVGVDGSHPRLVVAGTWEGEWSS